MNYVKKIFLGVPLLLLPLMGYIYWYDRPINIIERASKIKISFSTVVLYKDIKSSWQDESQIVLVNLDHRDVEKIMRDCEALGGVKTIINLSLMPSMEKIINSKPVISSYVDLDGRVCDIAVNNNNGLLRIIVGKNYLYFVNTII